MMSMSLCSSMWMSGLPILMEFGPTGVRDVDRILSSNILRAGTRNKECLSLGCDSEPLFSGRTPLDLYKGFIEAFADNFDYLFGEALQQAAGLRPKLWQRDAGVMV